MVIYLLGLFVHWPTFVHYDVLQRFIPLVFSFPLMSFTSLAMLLLFLFFLNILFSFGFCGAFGLALQMHDLVAFRFVFCILSSCQFCCFLDKIKVLGIPFRSFFVFSFLHDTLDKDIPYIALLKKDAQVTSMGFSFGVLLINLPIYSIHSPPYDLFNINSPFST